MKQKNSPGVDASSDVDSRDESPATFVSYSRRQLYFAEAIALNLQKYGINVWFDLQQLQPGTVWVDGLQGGVSNADRLILIASKAALESPYTRAEWLAVVQRGDPVVLVVFEPVDLPPELQGLPTYDFRSGFNRQLQELVAFLKGDAEPRHDRIPAPHRFGLRTRLPAAVWLTVAAQFGCLIACILSLVVAVMLNPGIETLLHASFWYVTAFTFAFGAWYALPFLRHTLEYRKIKRGVLVNLLLFIPTFLAIGSIGGDPETSSDIASDFTHASQFIFIGMMLLSLVVYLYLLRYSGGLLRWLRPEDGLQTLRRRAHQPLTTKTAFDASAEVEAPGKPIAYAIHADAADGPFKRFVEDILQQEGHWPAKEAAAPQHHIAILSNRSSAAWADALAHAYAGNITFIVASTIEFTGSLTEVGRYQWVDARDMNKLEIAALARSLGNVNACKREAAIETTPAMIDQWKVPTGITLLRRVLEWFGIYVLIFALTDLLGAATQLIGIETGDGGGDSVRSVWLVIAGATCFWLASKGLVYRKVPGPVLYGLLTGAIVLVTLNGQVLMQFMEGVFWLPGALLLLVVLNSWLSARAWLPAFNKPQPDEVGINKFIDRSFRRKRLALVALPSLVIVAMVVAMLMSGAPVAAPKNS